MHCFAEIHHITWPYSSAGATLHHCLLEHDVMQGMACLTSTAHAGPDGLLTWQHLTSPPVIVKRRTLTLD